MTGVKETPTVAISCDLRAVIDQIDVPLTDLQNIREMGKMPRIIADIVVVDANFRRQRWQFGSLLAPVEIEPVRDPIDAELVDELREVFERDRARRGEHFIP